MEIDMMEDNVLVEPLDENETLSDGGIVVPGKVTDKPVLGLVIAIGPGMKLDDGTRFPETLVKGDVVLFPKKSGDKIYLNGKDYIVIPARYVLARISEIKEEKLVPGLRDTPENREKMKHFNNGDCIHVDLDGNIIKKEN